MHRLYSNFIWRKADFRRILVDIQQNFHTNSSCWKQREAVEISVEKSVWKVEVIPVEYCIDLNLTQQFDRVKLGTKVRHQI